MDRDTFARGACSLWHGVEQLLLPATCVFCGLSSLAADRGICAGCDRDLPRIDVACRRCGAPLPGDADCAECQAAPPPYRRLIAPLAYEFPVNIAIKALKFERKMFYLPAFARLLQQSAEPLRGQVDAVLPVPLHRFRKMRRGFNQAMELARPVAGHLDVPLLDQVRRQKHTPYQSGLPRAERQANLRAAFRLQRPLPACRILIVDDVVTTGATAANLAAMLLQHGATAVSVLALARA